MKKLQTINAYCEAYGLAPVEPHGNAVKSYEAECDSCHIRLDDYPRHGPTFERDFHFTIGVGEVRHFPGRSRTPLGEFGMLSAYTEFKAYHNPENIVGSAIPGNELIGLKYRIGAVAPKSRDSTPINNLHDQYIQTHDVIRYLLMCVPQVIGKRASGKDPLCRPEHWETLEGGF